MRTFNPEEAATGTYIILSHVIYETDHLFVVQRGAKIQLVKIPTNLLTVPALPERDHILEIKEGAGYRIPVCRRPNSHEEVRTIKNYTTPGGTVRGGSRSDA